MKKIDLFVGKVIKTFPTHLILKNKRNVRGVLHISEISDYYINNIDKFFELDKEYTFEVISREDSILKLSWKSINPKYLKNPFKFEIEEVGSGIKNLLKLVEKEVNND